MKRHLLGLAVFSFIFASFAVIFAFIYAPKIPQIGQVEETRKPVFGIDRQNRCDYSRRRDENPSFKITQATLTRKERKFTVIIESDELKPDRTIKLHLFAIDEKESTQLTTEYCRIDKVSTKISCEFKLGEWLDKFNSSRNFYVIPELKTDGINFNPRDKMNFDPNKAIPVLLNLK